MTRAELAGIGLMLLTGFGIARAVEGAVRPLALAVPRHHSVVARTDPGTARNAPDSLVSAAIRKAGFRMTRRLGARPSPTLARSSPTASPAPVLTLAGIALGRRKTAIIDGIPGTTAMRVVREGDMVGGLHVTSITEQRVVVTGFDTVWTLHPAEKPE